MAKKPHVLLILDGWGYREDTDHNAIANGSTPYWDELMAKAPHGLISSSGLDVGLPDGQMGNSEVGHMSLGSGRIIYQNITKIDKAIETGEFDQNPVYCEAIDKAVAAGKAVHVLGLLSPGGVHSHENHIHAMVEMAAKRGAKKVYVHAFLDGRDVPPRSAEPSLKKMDEKLASLGVGYVASVVGRYYAMDRDNRWERVEQAYRLMTEGKSESTANSAVEALEQAYARDENDEFVRATAITPEGHGSVSIADGDAVIFMNFRADRAREITRAFVEENFDGFERKVRPALSAFVTTTEYAADIKAPCAFPAESVVNSFGEFLQNQDKTQLRIAETEKYAHVTFFFSGGREELYQGENRILVPSPDVATYDLKPEMSAPEVTAKLVEAIESGEYDAIICNYANGDMVGHTGIYDAAVKAAAAIDNSIKAVCEAAVKAGGEVLITADHGNCEQMIDYETGQNHTQHTTGPVPFVYVGERDVSIREGGRLSDVVPSMIALMGLEQPEEMTGHSLVQFN